MHDPTINRTCRNADGTEIENDIYIVNPYDVFEALEYEPYMIEI